MLSIFTVEVCPLIPRSIGICENTYQCEREEDESCQEDRGKVHTWSHVHACMIIVSISAQAYTVNRPR